MFCAIQAFKPRLERRFNGVGLLLHSWIQGLFAILGQLPADAWIDTPSLTPAKPATWFLASKSRLLIGFAGFGLTHLSTQLGKMNSSNAILAIGHAMSEATKCHSIRTLTFLMKSRGELHQSLLIQVFEVHHIICDPASSFVPDQMKIDFII